VSHIKYQPQEIPITRKRQFKVFLVEKNEFLKEVEIVGERNLKDKVPYTRLPDLIKSVYSFASVMVGNKIYIFGGNFSEETDVLRKSLDKNYMGTFEEFLQNVRKNRHYYGFSKHLYVYDLSTKKWTTAPQTFRKRTNHKAVFHQGKIYILGGKRVSNNRTREHLDSKLEVFDLNNQSITVDHTNPHRAVDLETFLYKNELIVVGGAIKKNKKGIKKYTNKIHSYHFDTGLWYELGTLPDLKTISGTVFHDKIYFFGTTPKDQSIILTLNLTSGKWKKEGVNFYPMQKPAIASHDHMIYTYENGHLLTYNTLTKALTAYDVDIELYGSSMYYRDEKLYILGGYVKNEFTKTPSRKLICIALKDLENTKVANYRKL
jgi:hypothetical protein